jgi:hypothetical protein
MSSAIMVVADKISVCMVLLLPKLFTQKAIKHYTIEDIKVLWQAA